VAALACTLASFAASRPARPYVDGPPPAHTGGFGEPTCAACHQGERVDPPGGALELVVPATFEPGGEHVVEVRLERPGMRRAGFQLSARFAGGELAGRQAGELLPVEAAAAARVGVVAAHGVSYAGHTAATAEIEAGGARWAVRWRAPAGEGAASPVVFHAAANAADYDDSELGDRVYVTSALSRPAAAADRRGHGVTTIERAARR
jgi:hypothetical protein